MTNPAAVATPPPASAAPAASAFPVKYIGEIDGLRAIAVLSVIFYHVGSGTVPGGFVGVDVFFVISGYLITGILLSGPREGGISLTRFYVRRVLRIAPALCVTLAATALMFFALFPPAMSQELLGSLASAALSYSNLWFYYTVDYFANDATNPVLHTWSLAVEEQFYLLFPLLLLLITRSGGGKRLPAILLGLFCLSLIASGIVAKESVPKAFYFPWLRAWELLAGSLLAASRPGVIADRYKPALATVGLLMIVAACLLYNNRMVFPGYSALLPVLGAAAVIAGAGSNGIANRILRAAPLRGIGRISYSLYLVHWPVVCAASLLLTLDTGKVKAAIVLSSILLAWMSWRFVETPFRAMAGRVPDRKILIAFAAVVAGFGPYFLAMQFAGSALWEHFPKALAYSEFIRTDTSFFREGTCFLTPKFDDMKYFNATTCLGGTRKAAIVIGDSHGANIVTALAAQHPALDLLQATASGCKPVLDARGPPYCNGLMQDILTRWLPASGPRVEFVVLAAWWAYDDMEALKRTIDHLRKMGKHVILYGPSPAYLISVPLLVAYEEISGVDLGDRLQNRGQRQMDARFRATFSGDVSYFSPFANLCSDTACALLEDGAPLFFDRGHLTRSGAERAVKGFPLP